MLRVKEKIKHLDINGNRYFKGNRRWNKYNCEGENDDIQKLKRGGCKGKIWKPCFKVKMGEIKLEVCKGYYLLHEYILMFINKHHCEICLWHFYCHNKVEYYHHGKASSSNQSHMSSEVVSTTALYSYARLECETTCCFLLCQ